MLQPHSLYLRKVYAAPLFLTVLVIIFLCFVALQFVFEDKNWNVVIDLFDWMATTPFGEDSDGIMYIVDVVFFALVGWAFKQWWRNPFDREKNQQLKDDLAQKYIEQNNLD